MGQHAEAEPLYQRALEIREKVLDAEHPDIATNLNNLALLLRDMGRYAEAEPLYQRALEIREKVLDAEHPNTATRASTTWPSFIGLKTGMPKPSHCISERWKSARRCSALSTPTPIRSST